MTDQTLLVNASELFNDFSSMDNFFTLNEGEEEYWNWPCEMGKGFFYVNKLKPGILLSIVNYQLKHPVSVYFSSLQNCCEISYPIFQKFTNANDSWQGKEDDFFPEKNKGCLSFISNWHGVANRPGNLPVIYIGIYVEPELFISFMEGSYTHDSVQSKNFVKNSIENQNYFSLDITPIINMKLYEILSCSYKGGLKRIFLESRTLDLIVLSLSQLSNINQNNNEKCFLLEDSDYENMRIIRNLLLENMKTPLSLNQLAKVAGMNKNKLNQSFREAYGSSIFEYLRISRLEKAKQLLMNGKMNVTEASYEVGYAQQSNFTKEFKKFYGKNPRSFLLTK